MPDFPSNNSAYGRWSLMDQRDAKLGGNWPALPVPASLSWQTNYNETISISGNVATSNGNTNSSGYGYFSEPLPAYSCYVDISLPAGYSGAVNFLGVSNTNAQFGWGNSQYYKAWYWSGSWFGAGTNHVNPPAALYADTYRIAVNRQNGRLYMKAASYATIASADLPIGSTLYIMNLPQTGYVSSGATIIGGVLYSGSGGLY